MANVTYDWADYGNLGVTDRELTTAELCAETLRILRARGYEFHECPVCAKRDNEQPPTQPGAA